MILSWTRLWNGRLAPIQEGNVPDHRLAHRTMRQVVRPDFAERAAKLGVIASMRRATQWGFGLG